MVGNFTGIRASRAGINSYSVFIFFSHICIFDLQNKIQTGNNNFFRCSTMRSRVACNRSTTTPLMRFINS